MFGLDNIMSMMSDDQRQQVERITGLPNDVDQLQIRVTDLEQALKSEVEDLKEELDRALAMIRRQRKAMLANFKPGIPQ